MQHFRAAANAKFTLLGFEVGLAGAWYDAEKGKPPQTIHHNIRLKVPTSASAADFSHRLSSANNQGTRTPMPARLLPFEQIAQVVCGDRAVHAHTYTSCRCTRCDPARTDRPRKWRCRERCMWWSVDDAACFIGPTRTHALLSPRTHARRCCRSACTLPFSLDACLF